MIETISRITNIGTFYEFEPEKPIALRKLTLVYGPNGTGKTTLCAILRSLARNDPDILVGRKTLNSPGDSRVELGLSGGVRCVWDGKAWSGDRPKIEIFDEQFVRENLYTDTVEVDHKRNLYRVIVGEEATKLANEVAELTKKSEEKQRELTQLQKNIESVSSGAAVDDFVRLPQDPDIEVKIAQKKKELAAHESAADIASKAALETLPVPELPSDLEEVLGRTFDTIEAEAERRLAAHLARCGGKAEQRVWLEQGLDFVHEETCPFCGQSLEGVELVRTYRAIFSETYRAHKDAIDKTRSALERDFGEVAAERLAKVIAENAVRASFWKGFVEAAWDAVENGPEWRAAWDAFFVAAKRALDDKLRTPLQTVPFEPLRPFFDRLCETLEELRARNERIRTVNTAIEERKRTAETGAVQKVEEELARLERVRMRYEPAVATDCERHEALRSEKNELDRKKKQLLKDLETRTKETLSNCKGRVNELLNAFGAGFRVREIREERPRGQPVAGWELEIRRTPVKLGTAQTPPREPGFKNTLSAGDRSALAFAFFLAQLEQKPDLAERIVVLDDPFTSQDWFRRSKTRALLVDLVREVKQVIICSHDSRFLLELQNALRDDRHTASFEIRQSDALGSLLREEQLEFIARVTTRADLEELRSFLERGNGKNIDIARKIRPVLEATCRRKYRGSVEITDTLGAIVSKAKQSNSPLAPWASDLDELNKYTRHFHHGDDWSGEGLPMIDTRELRAMVEKALRVVNEMETNSDS